MTWALAPENFTTDPEKLRDPSLIAASWTLLALAELVSVRRLKFPHA